MAEHEVSKNQPIAAPVEIRKMGLNPDAKVMLDRIAHRAYELFEFHGRTRGRDLDNWIAAETELFRPAPFKITESREGLKVEIDVRGFMPNELEVDLEPRRVTVIGKHHKGDSHKMTDGTVSEEHYSHLLRCLRLPAAIDTLHATASVNRGILQVGLRKSALM